MGVHPPVRRFAAAVAVAALAVVGCGDTAPHAERPTSSTASPAPAQSTAAAARALLGEACPEPVAPAGISPSSDLALVQPIVGQVLAYGQANPQDFGAYGLLWNRDGTDATVFASFTEHVGEHRDALARIVGHPEQLLVCRASLSAIDAERLEAQLVAELRGRFQSIGRSARGIEVVLYAGEETLAAELLERHGSSIELRVGALRYPLERATPVCEPPPASQQLPGLAIELMAPVAPMSTGGPQPVMLTLRLTNRSPAPIQFGSGTAIGVLLDGNGRVVNTQQVAFSSVGHPVALDPGASVELPLAVSAASCDPVLGFEVPPGRYTLVARVQHADGEVTMLTSAPAVVDLIH